MTSSAPPLAPLTECLDTAVDAVLSAWDAISHYHRGDFEVFDKPDGPATDADREADQAITGALLRRFPREEGYSYLTEEFEDDAHRLQSRRVWVIDPIDGTKYFIRGTDDFAMMVGLLEPRPEGWKPVLGVVFHPPAGLLYTAIEGDGAWVRSTAGENPKPERLGVRDVADPASGLAVFSGAKRPSDRLVAAIDRLTPLEHRRMGSLGLKMMEVAAGRADYYMNPELGKTMEWDVAGPAAILTEAGGVTTDLRGQPTPYNAKSPRLHGGVLASTRAINAAIVELLNREPSFSAPE